MLLYKYRPFNINTLKMAERTTIYYADPDTFNDPLDCNPGIQLPGSKARIEKVLKSFYSNNKPEQIKEYKRLVEYEWYMASDPENNGHKPSVRNRNYRHALLYEIKTHLRSHFGRTGVFSMAKLHSNMLMWSHYADNHRGICLGYKIDQRSGQSVHQARYDLPRKIPFSLIENWRLEKSSGTEKELKAHFFLTKSKDWSYENEYRLLRSPSGSKSGIGVQNAPSDIVEVMFGLYCDSSVKVAIVRLLTNSANKVKFYEMTTRASSFDLRRSRLDVGELLSNSPGLSLPSIAKDFDGFESVE